LSNRADGWQHLEISGTCNKVWNEVEEDTRDLILEQITEAEVEELTGTVITQSLIEIWTLKNQLTNFVLLQP
jgi:activator of HSP90 ATPase